MVRLVRSAIGKINVKVHTSPRVFPVGLVHETWIELVGTSGVAGVVFLVHEVDFSIETNGRDQRNGEARDKELGKG